MPRAYPALLFCQLPSWMVFSQLQNRKGWGSLPEVVQSENKKHLKGWASLPRFVRVQVKSTGFKNRGGYSCSVRGSRGAYVGDPFDFVAVYVVPEDVWYIIPAERFAGQGSIAVYPRLKKSKYGPYLGAWGLMKRDVL